MRGMVVVAVVAGCYNPSAPAGVPCADNRGCPADQQCIAGFCGGRSGAPDAAPDVAVDAAPLCLTWQPRHFEPCGLPAPLGELTLTSALSGFDWDTDAPQLKGRMNTPIDVATMIMTQASGAEVVVASVESFTLEAGANLDVHGSRALLIAVWGSANVYGSISADANFTTPGPGGSGSRNVGYGCDSAPTGDFGTGGLPATGGGGGALQGGGGRGGNVGALGGDPLTPPATIQGGCAGGPGGAGSSTQGARGAGGGAIVISARQSITIAAGGEIHAAGGGGGGGRVALGAGGGGGAGGTIGLDAPTVTIAGTLAANGGSGGGGASDVADGVNGANGRADAQPAIGGAGAGTSNIGACGRGGGGSSGGTLTGATGGSSSCGGAGGGGGAGYILIWSPTLDITGIVSPPVSAGP